MFLIVDVALAIKSLQTYLTCFIQEARGKKSLLTIIVMMMGILQKRGTCFEQSTGHALIFHRHAGAMASSEHWLASERYTGLPVRGGSELAVVVSRYLVIGGS